MVTADTTETNNNICNYTLISCQALKIALDNLYVAIRAGRSDLVHHILKSNSNLNLNSNLLRTSALSLAIRQQDLNIVSILLERGCDVNKLSMHESDRLESPLITATRLGNLAIVRLLLAYNANPNIADIDNRTPLWFATREKHTKICEALIEAGGNLNIADKTGMTPLHFCWRLEIAHMLVEHGANVNLPDFKGRLCLDYAEHSGSQFLVYLLLEAGSSISRDMRNRIRLYERARRRQSHANINSPESPISATTSGVSSASDYSSETDNNDDFNLLDHAGNQPSKLGFLITVRRNAPSLKSIMKRNIRRQLQQGGSIEVRKLHTSIWPKIDELDDLPEYDLVSLLILVILTADGKKFNMKKADPEHIQFAIKAMENIITYDDADPLMPEGPEAYKNRRRQKAIVQNSTESEIDT